MEQVLLCLQQTLLPDASAREHAEKILKQIEKNNGYTVVLLNIVASDQIDVHLRQSAAIALKRLTRSNWSENVITVFDEEEDMATMGQNIAYEKPEFLICDDDKKALKEKIVEAIICSPPKVRSQIGLALRNICDYDFPDQWPELIPKILHFLSSQDIKVMIGALESLRLVIKKYEYMAPGKGRRKPLQNLTASVYPILIQLFQALQVPTADSIESAQLQVLLCKTFWATINFGIPPYLQDDNNLLPWMNCFMSLLSRPIPNGQPSNEEDRIRWPWWVAKKWVGHIFQRMYNRFGDPALTEGGDMKAFAKKFEKNYAPKILEGFFATLAGYANGGWLPPKLLNAIFNFLVNGVRRPVVYKLMRPHLDKLLAGIAIPILRFTEKDLQLWKDDPQEYIRKEFDLEEEYFSPRSAALNLLVDVSNLRAKNHLAGIMQILAAELTSYASHQNPFVKEGTLVAIGAMVTKLSQSEYKSQLEPMLITHVLPEFNSPHGFLRSRACWIYQQYWELPFTNQDALLRALQGVLNCMQDKELPVKVTAALALKYLVQNSTAEAEVRKILPQVVDLYFKLMNEIDNDELVNALEILITQFEEEMIPYATEITARLSQSFLRMLKEDDEDSTVAAFECLSTIQTILESISTLPHMYPKMEEILLPVLDQLFNSNSDAEFLEDGLRIISFITCFSPAISQNMWALFPRIYQAFKDNGNDYVGELVTPIDNYVSKATDVFLSGPYLNLVFDIYKTVVGDFESLEEHVGDATKLAEVLLFNCKGKIDSAIEAILELALGRLAKAKNTFLKVLLLEVVSNSLFYNPALTLAILDKRNWLKDVFTLWLQLLPKFYRTHDKKVAILGLSSVFMVPQNMVPALVKAGLGQVMAAVIQLIMNLENQKKLIDEEQKKLEQEEQEEEEDDQEPIQELDDQEDDIQDDAEFEKLVKELKNADDDDSGDDISVDEDHIEDEENYSSIIDDIDEVVFYVDCIKAFHQNDSNSYNALSGSLTPELQNNFKEICDLAEKNRIKMLERQQQQQQQHQ